MRYANSGDISFDDFTIDCMIKCFTMNGESGPHSPQGGMLCHILNHCHASDIPFTLVYMPRKGYYVVRGMVDGVMPQEVRLSLESDL